MLSETIDYSPQKHSLARVRFKFMLDDGRKVLRGPINCVNEADANSKRIAMEPSILLHIKQMDADHAIEQDVISSHRTSSVWETRIAWMKRGYNESEPYKAYKILKRIMVPLLALGKTDQEYSERLGITLNTFQALENKWLALAANSVAIEAYAAIEGGV